MGAAAWSAIAEALGIASSVFLLMPAIALNRHLRQVHASEKALEASTSELFRAIGEAGRPTLKDARIPEWSRRDQRLLVLGIATFGVSSVIKLVLVLSQAGAPPPAATGAPQGAAAPPVAASAR